MCHSRESGNPDPVVAVNQTWIPAFVGMTIDNRGLFPCLQQLTNKLINTVDNLGGVLERMWENNHTFGEQFCSRFSRFVLRKMTIGIQEAPIAKKDRICG